METAQKPQLQPPDGSGILPTPEPFIGTNVESSAYSAYRVDLPSEPDLFESSEDGERRIFVRVYALMCAGLMLTALMSYWTGIKIEENGSIEKYRIYSQLLFFVEVICAGVFAKYAPRFSWGMLCGIFFGYAIFNGVSFCVFLLLIPSMAVTLGFLLSGVMFGCMALYGYFSQRDVGVLRYRLWMFAVGFGLAIAVHLARGSSNEYWAASMIAVAIFAALTTTFADDIRYMPLELEDQNTWKSALCGALVLYLGFVGLYLIAMRMIQEASNGSRSRDGE